MDRWRRIRRMAKDAIARNKEERGQARQATEAREAAAPAAMWTMKTAEKPAPELLIKKLREDAKVPTRGTPGSAGLDLYSVEAACISPGYIIGLSTGLAFEIPEGHFGILATRSSMGKNGVRIAAGANIIDNDYRGEVIVYLRNDGEYDWYVRPGDRVAQLVVAPCCFWEPEVAEELSETSRGTGGWGSTGR